MAVLQRPVCNKHLYCPECCNLTPMDLALLALKTVVGNFCPVCAQVTMVGSGAWACAAARMVAQNTSVKGPAQQFDETVGGSDMW